MNGNRTGGTLEADAAVSSDKRTVFAAAVVYDRIECRIIEVRYAKRPVRVP